MSLLADRAPIRIRRWCKGDIPGLMALAERNGVRVKRDDLQRQIERDRESTLTSRSDRFLRLVAEWDGGEIVGTAVAHCHVYVPHGWLVGRVHVDERYRDRGVGSALADNLNANLADIPPTGVECRIRKSDTQSLLWAERRGFRTCSLDLTYFLDPSAASTAMLTAHPALPVGVTLHPMADAVQNNLTELIELTTVLLADLPGMEGAQPPSAQAVRTTFTRWVSVAWDASWVAVDRERLIGVAIAGHDSENDLYGWLTGVAREHRGMGVAKALRLRVIGSARSMGVRRIIKHVSAGNTSALALNKTLGCVLGETVCVMRRPFQTQVQS